MNKLNDNNNLVLSLRDIYKSDVSARALFDWFGTRVRGAAEIEVEAAVAKAGVEYSSVIRVFRKLAELGCGRFIEGRRGFKSRMAFTYSIVELGEVACGNQDQVPAVSKKQSEFELEEENSDINLTTKNFVSHQYQLRPDFSAELRLPKNLTEKETERLSAFIKTLPF